MTVEVLEELEVEVPELVVGAENVIAILSRVEVRSDVPVKVTRYCRYLPAVLVIDSPLVISAEYELQVELSVEVLVLIVADVPEGRVSSKVTVPQTAPVVAESSAQERYVPVVVE